MKTIGKILILNAILIYATAAGATNSATNTLVKASFETIEQGIWSHYAIDEKQHMIEITNQNDWQTFWDQHTNNISPAPQLPEIDFQQFFILIAIDEIRASGGYTLEITEITIDTAAEHRPFVITLQAKQPGSASANISALTRPYHIVRVKK